MTSTTLALLRGSARAVSRRAGRGRVVNVGQSERLVSMVTGGALAMYALRRRSLTGAVVGLVGSALVYRGATGHSRVYEAMGVQGPAARVPGTITIQSSPETIERVWRDTARFPHPLLAAEVNFQRLSDQRGTQVNVAASGKSADEVRETLRTLKQMVETGEIPTTNGQPSGRRRRH